MYAILLLLSAVGMMAVTRIKNDIVRAAIGLPLTVAMFMFGMMTFASAISAQWIPDRPDYEFVRDGNFYMLEQSRRKATNICLETLKNNGVNMYTIEVDESDTITPINTHLNREPGFVYIAYVTKRKSGDYVICFRYLEDKPWDFEEDFVILEYEGME